MKIIEVKAGERKRIIRRLSSSMQKTYHFAAEPVTEGEVLSGTIEVKGSRWIFPKATVMQKLEENNTVEKGMWDTIYSVHVIPECDVKIMFIDARLRNIAIYLTLAIFIAVIAIIFVLSLA
ncbi:MAG: hypothetical protein JKX91_12235 [Rhizobiaceae bacterium]|nr:hypothetical protein [Rhizobiaceae bacterium]